MPPSADHDPDADWSLPGWLYTDPEYYAVEMARVIRPSWQIVCHQNDLAEPGAFHTLDYLGESIIAVRGDDHEIRAFANVCRHRAMRLVEGPSGCAKKLVCPYHAWTYETDGRLTGVPMRRDYPALDLAENGLARVDLEIWRGFVFVRLEGDGPSIAEMMALYDAQIAPYRFEEMQTLSPVRLRDRAVNWKNVGDNYSDNLHIPVAHDGLTRLFGKSYAIEAEPWVDKMSGRLVDRPSDNPWERFYQTHLPPVPHLPEANQRLWLYFKLWPNMAFDLYADQIDFMQWLPTSPTRFGDRARFVSTAARSGSKSRSRRLVRISSRSTCSLMSVRPSRRRLSRPRASSLKRLPSPKQWLSKKLSTPPLTLTRWPRRTSSEAAGCRPRQKGRISRPKTSTLRRLSSAR